MEWLLVFLLLPIGWAVVGAAVLATVDRDGEFFRFCKERNSAGLAILFFPIAAFAILSGRKKLNPTEKIESPKNF